MDSCWLLISSSVQGPKEKKGGKEKKVRLNNLGLPETEKVPIPLLPHREYPELRSGTICSYSKT
eukprot:2348067-Rhodomonas_salina.2